MHYAFLYISLPSLHDYDVSCLISRFINNLNIRRRIFLSLFKLEYSTVGKFAYSGQSELVGIIALKFQRTRSHILSDVFTVVAVVVSKTPYCLDLWCTVEPPVGDHPKCKDRLVPCGRWSFTRIEPSGVSSDKRSRHIYFMEDNLLHAMSKLRYV